MSAAARERLEQRLVIVAPTAKDAAFVQALLDKRGVDCAVCSDLGELAGEIGRGAAAVMLAEEALAGGAELLAEAIAGQPSWSDLPVLLLTHRGADSPAVLNALDSLGNVTLLERPIRIQALLSAVRTALRARGRQYQTRAHLRALQETDQRKDEFLATLAHELRNPLAPIRNSVELLRRSGAKHPGLEQLSALMDRQVGHMVRLVDDLLEISRITRGRIELRKSLVELKTVIDAAVETSQPLIEAGRHRLSISLPAEPLNFEADATRLAQVFANLLNNAAKYTDEGGEIFVSAAREGESAVVFVRDTGVGIPADMLPRVFEMFVQVDRAQPRAQGGVGIGLTLVRSLVEMHGGSVSVASAGPGKGSVFTVRLPLAAAQQRPAAARQPVASGALDGSPRVLIVDDNHDAADALGSLLGMLGAQVCVVHDGPAALEAVGAHQPALVFLDLGMPGMDGFEVARRIRAQDAQRETRLVALTGWGQEKDRQQTAAAGFDQHLIKPADIGALQALLVSLAGRPPRVVDPGAIRPQVRK